MKKWEKKIIKERENLTPEQREVFNWIDPFINSHIRTTNLDKDGCCKEFIGYGFEILDMKIRLSKRFEKELNTK